MFVFASGIETYLNSALRWRPNKGAWWITWLNNIGAIWFIVPSAAALWDDTNLIVPAGFFSGCVSYAIAGILGLFMFKLNFYGISWMPFLNFAEH